MDKPDSDFIAYVKEKEKRMAAKIGEAVNLFELDTGLKVAEIKFWMENNIDIMEATFKL